MNVSFKLKAGAALLAISATGSAFAQTSLNTSAGSVFLDVYDTVNGDSYLLDTSLTQATFNASTGNYSFNLTSDSVYQQFLTAAGSDYLEYDVLSATKTGYSVYSTVNGPTTDPTVANVTAVATNTTTYMGSVNEWSANNLSLSSKTSTFINSSSDPASFGFFEEGLSADLGVNDLGAIGTALAFYSFSNPTSARGSGAAPTSLLAGDWLLTNGVLTYTTSVAAVPVPASWGLLLGGLALMGVIARRKTGTGESFAGFAA